MRIKKKIIAIASVLLLAFNLCPVLSFADDCTPDTSSAKGLIGSGVDCAAGPSSKNPASLDDTVKTVINLLSVIVGIAAIIMIILAGLKYITSSGEAEKVKSAKGTLVYAIIGLVIVALAQTIVHFVLTEATTPTTPTTTNTDTQSPSSGSGRTGSGFRERPN